MASVTLSGVEDQFPAGTTVEVYEFAAKRSGAAPDGEAVTSSAVTSSGTLTFAGLEERTQYVAYAQVGGAARYRSFRASDAEGSSGNPLVVESSTPNEVVRGTAAGTVTALDAGDKLHSILVVPSSGGQVTVTVFDDAADQCPTDFPYSEDFKGRVAPATADIVIAGSVAYYRVTYEDVA